ncbi:hypothetical protein M434DRAFT_398085 [Hypoxylon sp. CO27-5]|nr:hypothetical protein M434DRAFT_398085 [Hypoxylon sp. CO27-5]
MASGQNDPKLLYAIPGVSAYHLAYGKEESLTPAGPQTLSLLMVPTSSPFADPAFDNQDGTQAEDFYLHLHLPPELDIPLPATTQIYHQPPRSYLIPRWDLGPDSGAFTRIEFPPVGSREGLQEDVDTFETILAQCTAFLERAPPPKTARKEKEKGKSPSTSPTTSTKTSPKLSKSKLGSSEQLPAYNPATYKPGEGYVKGSQSSQRGGQIVLVDEEDGSVIGELSEGYQVVETGVKPGSKDPVEITLPQEGTNKLAVVPASPETLEIDLHPAYKKSFLVSKAAYASRLIITTSDFVSNAMQSGSESFVKKTKPAGEAVTFTPATHDRVRRIGKFSGGVADLSSKTVGQVTKLAQNVGATIAGRGVKEGKRGYGPDGKPLDSFKPGLLNKSLMAFTTVADGIDQATRNILTSASSSATNIVAHKWGPEAGELSKHIGGSVKNVGLVYIDVTGVSRKAVIKAVGKGMVVGKVKGGGEIIVGDDTAGIIPAKGSSKRSNDSRTNLASDSASSSASESKGKTKR